MSAHEDLTFVPQVSGITPFYEMLPEPECAYTFDRLHTLQINIGAICNLACKHCHIDAGPQRTEVISREVLEDCLQAVDIYGFETVDITGGAPEMAPDFEWFIDELASRPVHVIVRSNLCVLKEERFAHLIEKYAQYHINVVASLPGEVAAATDAQRGSGVFDATIEIMQRLNELGYGNYPKLKLDLVYNPRGAFLPPDQAGLEVVYKERLMRDHGVVFNNLFTMTNNPIGRFGRWLEKSRNLERYMHRLADSFNSETCRNMMCRDQIMVNWRGEVFDCDFNLALEMPCVDTPTIADFVAWARAYRDEHAGASPKGHRAIRFAQHCYACTAGAGSS